MKKKHISILNPRKEDVLFTSFKIEDATPEKKKFLLAITPLQDYNFSKKFQIHERFKFFLPIFKKTCQFLFLLLFFLFQLVKFMLHLTFLGLKFSF
jgi:hypothetical protein